jgi:tubulin monoglycylase TTLL3/8
MREIIIDSLTSVSELIIPRKSTIEMYGYDFMIDEDYNPHLIEVNSSPCMEYSTHVTEKLVKGALEDFGKLVCDYMLNKKILKSQDVYGGWQLIHSR